MFRMLLTISLCLSWTAWAQTPDHAESAACCAAEEVQSKSLVSDIDPDRLWCNKHGVYEDECTICHPELASKAEERDPNRLWCNEHGVYEDECTICHPELASKAAERDANRLWCGEHDRYEDECTICHPELAAVSGPQGPPDVLWCGEHDLAEQECGICHPELIAGLAPGQGLKVRFESSESARKAGVRIGNPELRTVNGGDRVFARISYDRNALAVVTPLLDGVLNEVMVDVGDEVAPGDTLAVVHSRELAAAKSAYITALAENKLAERVFQRQKDLHAEDVSTDQQLDEARAALEARRSETSRARQHLLNLGLTDAEVDAVAQSGVASSELPVRAPFAGTVVERTAVMGSAVETGDMLFEIADLSTMWLELSVPESQMVRYRPGMPVVAEFDAYPGREFEGLITWAAHRVDENTRMLQVRAELPNGELALKHGMFGHVRLAPRAISRLAVPEDALQVIDGRTVVFAKLNEDLYETRVVSVGGKEDGWAAIDAGLAPTDQIAVAESYVLKSELLKARLGAGCTDH